MPATHSGGNLFPSGTPVAGGTSVSAAGTATSAVVNNSAGYGITLTVQITNGATGPTVPASLSVMVSADNTTFVLWASDQAGAVASTSYTFAYQLPPEISYAKIIVTGNTAQAVTAIAQYNTITAL